MRSTTDSGLLIESRSAFPREDGVVPNDNDPADVPPATVGPPAATPGDPNGVEIIDEGGAGWSPPVIRPSAWSGWPAEWDTPNWWGRVELMTDVAWNCMDLNASVVSIMPPYLVDPAPSLDADWLSNPDPSLYPSWIGFAKDLMWQYELGEAFVLATAYYATGKPARFHVVPGWLVNVDWVDGQRSYAIGGYDVTADILHIPYQIRSDELRGHGPLEVGRYRVVAAATILRYATNLLQSGGIPPAVLKHPARLSAKQARDLVFQWADARMSAMGLTAVLSGGIDYEVIGVDPEKLGLVDLEKFHEARIASLLGVHPFLVGLPSGGDSMTYSNVNNLFDFHWRAGLSPKATTLMSALAGWLLPRGTGLEVNRDEYVKPGPLERAQTWEILTRIGVLSVEEVRTLERYSVSGPSTTLNAGVLQ